MIDVQLLTDFLGTHGYLLLFAVGFVESAGIPLASGVVLVVGGGLAAGGALHFPLMVAAAASGAFLADTAWYGLTRWQGSSIVGVACGLTSDPSACILDVRNELQVMGKPYIVVGKLIPGTANLLAPAAGLAGLSARAFLPRVAVALVVWASAYAGVGWLFAEQVSAAVVWVLGYLRVGLVVVAVLLLAAVIWRVIRVRRHGDLHQTGSGAEEPSPPETEAA